MDDVGDASAARGRQPHVRELLPVEDVLDGGVARDQPRGGSLTITSPLWVKPRITIRCPFVP